MADTESTHAQRWLKQWHTCNWYCQGALHADVFMSITAEATLAQFQHAVNEAAFPLQLRALSPAPEAPLEHLVQAGEHWCDTHQQKTAHCRCVHKARYAWRVVFAVDDFWFSRGAEAGYDRTP